MEINYIFNNKTFRANLIFKYKFIKFEISNLVISPLNKDKFLHLNNREWNLHKCLKNCSAFKYYDDHFNLKYNMNNNVLCITSSTKDQYCDCSHIYCSDLDHKYMETSFEIIDRKFITKLNDVINKISIDYENAVVNEQIIKKKNKREKYLNEIEQIKKKIKELD